MQYSLSDNLTFRPFASADYPAYRSWFANDDIDWALGPIDEAWLTYILGANEGIDYAVHRSGRLVAVIGLVLGDEARRYSVITNLAVNPNLFNQGIGTAVLHKLYELHPLTPGTRWVAYAARENTGAQRFFLRNGYVHTEDEDVEMLTYSRSVTR